MFFLVCTIKKGNRLMVLGLESCSFCRVCNKFTDGQLALVRRGHGRWSTVGDADN